MKTRNFSLLLTRGFPPNRSGKARDKGERVYSLRCATWPFLELARRCSDTLAISYRGLRRALIQCNAFNWKRRVALKIAENASGRVSASLAENVARFAWVPRRQVWASSEVFIEGKLSRSSTYLSRARARNPEKVFFLLFLLLRRSIRAS